MGRLKRRTKQRFAYTDAERYCLLTGMALSSASTRFGHPLHSPHLGHVRDAWAILKAELSIEWQGPQYAKWRARNATPWAERVLAEAKSCPA
jgi:hypothetical protein